jgi:MscS family membrane protein
LNNNVITIISRNPLLKGKRMQSFFNMLDESLSIFHVPGTKIFVAVIIIIIALIFRKIFSIWILKYLKKMTEKTKSELDDALLDILNPPLSFLIMVTALSLSRVVLAAHITEPIYNFIGTILEFSYVLVICWLIYRCADVFTAFLEKMASRTRTELDDLIVPYMRKIIKIAAIIMVFLKAAEIFLGMSAAALLGFLGGMGLTMGLVFKDIIANWFGCAVIYIDNLFREGDWVQLDAGNIVDADVEEIGLRSTKFRNFDKTISIVPNATIAAAVVKNWSRMYKRRVKFNFTIDGLESLQMEAILDGIRNILSTDNDVHQEFHMVNFREISGNSRIVRLYYFTKTIAWKEHEKVRENVNLKILGLFEQNGIDKLAYTIIDMSDDQPREFQKNLN